MKRPLPLLLILLFFSFHHGHTQAITPSVLNTSGNTYTGGFYSFDWSVGELALVTTMRPAGSALMVTNGFFQPGSADKKQGEDNFAAGEIMILPNPTHGIIEVRFHTRQQGVMNFIVYDNTGRRLLEKKVVSFGGGGSEKINLTAQPNGTYFLQLTLVPAPGSVPKIGTYKIIKL